jgi:hypothetical protein
VGRRTERGSNAAHDGKTIEDLPLLRQARTITMSQAIYLGWLEMFRRLQPEMTRRPPRG